MCIIVAKEKGKKLPSKDILKTCFDNNSDGAGLMYVQDNKVVIDKGYMTFKSFYKRIKKLQKRFNSDLTDKAIVIHFRIGTSGEKNKSTTHPFPISSNSEDLKKTYIKTDLGIVHNGIISGYVYGKDLSDTQNFVKDFLEPLKELNKNFYKNDKILNIIDKELGGKLAILDTKETITYIGSFETENGVKYSNSTYKTSRYTYSSSKFTTYNYPSYSGYNDYNDYNDYNSTYDTYTLDEFIKNNIKYEILKSGDFVEYSNYIKEVLNDRQYIVDEFYNLYEMYEYNEIEYIDLVGTDVVVFDKNYEYKDLIFEGGI